MTWLQGSSVSALAAFVLLLSGCASTLHLDVPQVAQPFRDNGTAVYVTNPELAREYAILKNSGIYRLSDTPHGARRLTLRPIARYGRCGNPLLLSAITFGVVPGFLPAAMHFTYDLEGEGMSQLVTHRLPLYERFSIWERRAAQRGDDVISEALKFSKPERPDQAPAPTAMSVTLGVPHHHDRDSGSTLGNRRTRVAAG